MVLPIALLAALAQVRFEVTIAPDARAESLTGRVLVIVAKSARPEPRFAISPSGPAMFGVDVEGLEPGEPVLVDDSCTGYPWPLRELPPGDYHVQALVDVYEQVKRGD